MHAYRNKTVSQYGQVVESQIDLLANVSVDMKDKYYIFQNVETGQFKLKIKQSGTQLWYNVQIEGEWSEDIPLTIDDPDELKNLPIYPNLFNSNTYARMDQDFRLYFEGGQYLRIAPNVPTVYFGETLRFAVEDSAVVASVSQTGLDMNANRITSLANPAAATDAVNRYYLEKFDMPIGAVIAYYANSVPVGWLYCDGTTFNQVTYPELYSLLGGNVLPDLRGQFLRGTSDSNAVDPSGPRTVGSYQTDDFKSHTHTGTTYDAWWAENQGGGQNRVGADGQDYDNDLYTRTVSLAINATGGSETRPKNIAVRYIIKALPSGRI